MIYPTFNKYSLRSRIFIGFLAITFLSITCSLVISYIVFKNNIEEQNLDEQTKTSNSLMMYLNYVVSHQDLSTNDLPKILINKIYEVSDVLKIPVVIYDLEGNLLITSSEIPNQFPKKISNQLVKQIIDSRSQIDVTTYKKNSNAKQISLYILLRNNNLDPIGIIYFHHYYNAESHIKSFNKFINLVLLVNIFIIVCAALVSWWTSKSITLKLFKFSDFMNRVTLLEANTKPIRYYKNDELEPLVRSYNRMILKINEQKDQMFQNEKETAWKEMAKQVAHEVKNPLTPMKLKIQNFRRKFDIDNPNTTQNVFDLTNYLIQQIDEITTVATAFSHFAQLPEKNNEIVNLKSEIFHIIKPFSETKIKVESNEKVILINIDKKYINRIITNLIKNSIQAEVEDRELKIHITLEQINRRVKIFIKDNGCGISDEILSQLFKPSFSENKSGKGFGLAMVKKMVEDYDGEISLETNTNGSVFCVNIPNHM